MKQKKDYFTTGEFARICGVRKQTLFYYDSIGIFSPEIVGDNGYRYYSYTQVETFAVLTMFKELRVPLKDIKNLMENRSPEALIKMLEEKDAEIDKKIERLRVAKTYVHDKIAVTREGMNAPVGEIVFEDLPDEYMVTTDYAGIDDDKAVEKAVSEHFNFCQSLGIQSAYAMGGIIPRDSVTEDGYRYSQFYTIVSPEALTPQSSKEAFIDSGGHYIAMYDDHGYENVSKMCLKIIDYAKEHGLALDDCFYEDVILDDLSVNGYYKYLVKVSARVH